MGKIFIKKNTKQGNYIYVGVLLFVAIFFMGHADVETIVKWGISLWDHICRGSLHNYANDLIAENLGTNYTLVQNGVVALWISPIYLLQRIGKREIDVIVFATWLKVGICLLHLFCAREIYVIAERFGLDDEKSRLCSLMYLLSPFVLIHGIGIGQIDAIGIFFFLLSVRFYFEKKYMKMAFCIGLAVMSKYFVLMFYVPVLLLFYKKILKNLKYIFGVFVFPVIDKVLTGFLIDDYSRQADYHNKNIFVPRLFAVSINGISVVLMVFCVLCGYCFLKSYRNEQKDYHIILMPLSVYISFYMFVYWHPQWYLYVLPIVIIVCILISDKTEGILLYVMTLLSFDIYSLGSFNQIEYNALRVDRSILGKIVDGNVFYISPWIEENISPYFSSLGITAFMGCNVLLLVCYFKKKRIKPEMSDETRNIHKYQYICGIPSVLYMLALLVPYFLR